MKTLLKYLFIFCTIILFSCDKESIPNVPIDDKVSEEFFKYVCKDWGTDKANVKSKMSGYTLIETSDDNVLQFTDKEESHKVCYEFADGKLRASMMTFLKGSQEVDNTVLDLKSYKYMGQTDGGSIYTDALNNTMFIYMEKADGNSNIYIVLGFTPMTSDLYENVEPISVIIDDPTDIEPMKVTMKATLNGANNIEAARFYVASMADMSDSKWYSATISGQQISKSLTLSAPNQTIYYYAEVKVGDVWYQSSTATLEMPKVKIYAIGDPYPDKENPIGVVCAITNQGMNGTIVSLDQDWLKWDEKGIFCYDYPSYNTSDGSKNNMGNVQPYAKWVASHGEGWFGPARAQLLFTVDNLKAINNGLKALDKRELDGFYWSSSQRDSNTAWVVTVTETSYMGYSNKYYFYNSKDQSRSIRAMKHF